ncbi:hypothetical protein EYS42_16570 [Aquabacterium lacunae]|uniref:Uncharacterized protein n=1 Tax=Aquabacterium lacunae TaxID=2528630 RepID=A0A4Q9GVF8_9BURK|nr:Imm49 family immunity protein [Aquabacterium lacunae]TBO27718.1 hypothetical protein EYS42_16570 [Aquabacterium lacunae]
MTIVLSHYSPEQIRFLKERKERINDWEYIGHLPRQVAMIDRGEGSFDGCLSNLKRLHEDIANYAWFGNRDLATFKLQSYLSAKFLYMIAKATSEEGVMREAEYFYALLSDHEPVIRWMMQQSPHSTLFKQRMVNPTQNEYRYYQLTLALNGQWNDLGSRAEMFLQDVPAKMKKYAPDMRFYLALAQQDKAGMESALAELTSPKVAKVRNEVFELVVPSQFVSPFACLYAKAARRYGFELDVDTALIPKEWLPVSPLPAYLDPYEFMRSWSIV